MAHLRNSTRANALRAKIIGIGSAEADLGGRAHRAVSVDEMAKPVLSPRVPGTTGAAIQAIRKRSISCLYQFIRGTYIFSMIRGNVYPGKCIIPYRV